MTHINNYRIEFSSFRDPSGFVFRTGDIILRQINHSYKEQYEYFISSGLYQSLLKDGSIIEHKETNMKPINEMGYKVIEPKRIPFISYPYEWCFSQLKEAALLTLKIHRRALDYNMILKDATAYNIQFYCGSPVFIDTLSFDFYKEGDPWFAYGQFCRHFLAPLFLMRYCDVRLLQLMRDYIDGIPLDLASNLLGKKGGFAATQHIRWHSKVIQKYSTANTGTGRSSVKLSKTQQIRIVESLIRIIESLKLKKINTEWGEYTNHVSYSEKGAKSKLDIIISMLEGLDIKVTWDLGANDGYYSRLALVDSSSEVIAFDIDQNAVERNYNKVKKTKEHLLPLLMDLTNPSPSIGFANEERKSLLYRDKPDMIFLLAVIHHLAISNNVPLEKIAKWLSQLSRYVIIEFVPKEDIQVQTLLRNRIDIFTEYDEESFRDVFSKYFDIVASQKIEDSLRTLYLLRNKSFMETEDEKK